jgi:hypothetical protein
MGSVNHACLHLREVHRGSTNKRLNPALRRGAPFWSNEHEWVGVRRNESMEAL